MIKAIQAFTLFFAAISALTLAYLTTAGFLNLTFLQIVAPGLTGILVYFLGNWLLNGGMALIFALLSATVVIIMAITTVLVAFTALSLLRVGLWITSIPGMLRLAGARNRLRASLKRGPWDPKAPA